MGEADVLESASRQTGGAPGHLAEEQRPGHVKTCLHSDVSGGAEQSCGQGGEAGSRDDGRGHVFLVLGFQLTSQSCLLSRPESPHLRKEEGLKRGFEAGLQTAHPLPG